MTHPAQLTGPSLLAPPRSPHPAARRAVGLETLSALGGRVPACTPATAAEVERKAGMLATRAVARMKSLPWFAAMPAEVRASAGLIAQRGITVFARWLRRPDTGIEAATAVFTAAPATTARLISLQQAVALIRITLDVLQAAIDDLAGPEDRWHLYEAVWHFSRELGFATAFAYAQAAEQRGAWDARLESLLLDAILRGDTDDTLASRAAALGWTAQEPTLVIAGQAPAGTPGAAVRTVQRIARAAGLDALAGVQAGRLITVVGNCAEPTTAADAVLKAYGQGPVVAGPVVAGLMAAHHSAAAALAGLRAVCMWPDAPRPVAADDLLPERVLDGDRLAVEVLLKEVYRPLKAAGEPLVATVSAYLQGAHSVEAAAKRLFVHPNTVRYRLGRAAAACGRAAAQPRDAQVLQMALALGRRTEERPRM